MNRDIFALRMAGLRYGDWVPATGPLPKTLAALTDGVEVRCPIENFEPERLEVYTTGGELFYFDVAPADPTERHIAEATRKRHRLDRIAGVMDKASVDRPRIRTWKRPSRRQERLWFRPPRRHRLLRNPINHSRRSIGPLGPLLPQ